MRTIKAVRSFKRDYNKRLAKTFGGVQVLDAALRPIVVTLANDLPLTEQHCDHAMISNWKDHRNCHVRPDIVLIYRKPDDERLQLVRLGSHAELGL
jgi:mRNA interferase YafQ